MKVYRVRGKYYADKEKANEQFEKLVKSQIDFEPVKEVLGDLTVIRKPDGEKFATYYELGGNKFFNRSIESGGTFEDDVYLYDVEVVGDKLIGDIVYTVRTDDESTLFASKEDAINYLNKLYDDTINSDRWKSVFNKNGIIKEGYFTYRGAERFLICTDPFTENFKEEDYESASASIGECHIEV